MEEKRKRGRPKGSTNKFKLNSEKQAVTSVSVTKVTKRVMSEEHKKNLLEGRKKAIEARKAQGLPVKSKKKHGIENKYEKPIMYISGKEKDAFDFFRAIRDTFRPRHDYHVSPMIIRKIVKNDVWNDVSKVKLILNEYVVLKVKK